MAECASTILGPVVGSLMGPVKKHMGYLFSSTERVRNMTTKMKQLEGKFGDVKNHKDTNERKSLEVPTRVPSWLEEVTKIKSDVETISSNENGCFNIKARYQMGRNVWKTTQEIELHLQEERAFSWTDAPIPPGRVDTSATSSGDNIKENFESRATTLKDALKFLQQDQKTQLIALCGMGGVGKTTMMEKLKKYMEDKKMFGWIVKVVIGNQPNLYSTQNDVAKILGHSLTDETKTRRADCLSKIFEEILKQSEKGILVILDDVWKKIELGDLGLSPLPNGVKLLLTSRDEHICKQIAVEGNLEFKVLPVNVLEQTEAHKFFCQITEISEETYPELYEIGGDIVKKCSCLPLAIKLIASNLISEERSIWKDCLARLRNNDLEPDVQKIIKISFDYIKDQEDKEVFLLCGLFPEDSNIPIEDLTRYAWGLKLLNGVSTVEGGRNRIKKCVRNLRKANLLIDADYRGCVKMHDLVLAFVLDTISEGDYTSIVNHGDMSNWSNDNMRESCKRISLTCRGKCGFPEGFKYPNLSLLKLMHGDDSFEFPQGFYENMEKLYVIAYEAMQHPSLPRSFQCSTNLRTLCLHRCSLMFDLSFIGDLLNLEVLSITDCYIRKLPSTFGNLKKLKVLDLTNCYNLLIDDGVLNKLVNLEELYMIRSYGEAVRFTDANVDELVECSKNLTALAIRFNALPKNISFKKLERFKISLGCDFQNIDDQSEYTLRLVTEKRELLDSGMNRLLEKTEVLYLQVNGVNDLEDSLAEPLHHRPSFSYLRVLEICKCADLRYLFTVRVANNLKMLESLTISLCPVLETVVDGNIGGVGVIKFQVLKFLSLGQLPKLKSLCNIVGVIQLPQLMELQLNDLPNFTSIYPLETSSTSITIYERQSFLNKEDVIPKLEKLHIRNMENLEEVWPSSEEANVCILREIRVEGCDSVVNLFPRNPMSLLHHLEELYVENCSSIEVLFNIDLGCIIEETSCCLRRIEVKKCKNLVNLFPSNPMSLLHHLEELTVEDCGSIEVLFNIDLGCIIEETSCCLRSIKVQNLGNLREVIKCANDSGLVINVFQALERLEIIDCERFRNVFTPTTTNFDMRALSYLIIEFRRRQEQEINEVISEQVGDDISNVVISTHLIHTTFHHLRRLEITDHERAEVVFEVENPCSRELATAPQQPPLLPYLKDLWLNGMECMSHVWKCNWNIPQNQQSFHNLTTITLYECKNMKYLFSPLMANLLSNLKNIYIRYCDVIEEVVSNRDDEDEELVASTSTNISISFFPHLDILYLERLPNLKRIGGGSTKISSTTPIHHQSKEVAQVNDVSWSLCQYSRYINVSDCRALPYVIPSYALDQMQKLEELEVDGCGSLVEVFETQGSNINGCDEGSGGNDATMVIQGMKKINVPQLSNLKRLKIYHCDLLEHVLTFSTLESLMQLEVLNIRKCNAMKVIVKEDNEEQTTISSKVVVFPHLKSIQLQHLPNLMGFFLGKNEFEWPSLNDVEIVGCPQMMVFTSGCSIAQKLNYIRTELGKHSLEQYGLNFPVMAAATLHERPFSRLDTTSSSPTTSKGSPWSFHNLIEMNVKNKHDVKKIIPSNEFRQLQKLEKIHVWYCHSVEEVFEALEGTDGNELQSVVVEIPKLREVELKELENLKYIWKNNPWMVLEFPNLTKLSIDRCNSLVHVFSSSMVGSLLQLQDLHISGCRRMKVIVKEEECDDKVNEIIMLPRLKSLTVRYLPRLKGFYLGKEAFSWSSLDTLDIEACPAITVFTMGHLTTPKLKVIDTSFGRCELVTEQDLNSFINTKLKEGLKFGQDEDETVVGESFCLLGSASLV